VTETAQAQLIDGKAVAAELRAEVAERAARFAGAQGRQPALATVLVGDDPASQVYVSMKHKACEEAGIRTLDHRLPQHTPASELSELIGQLNENDEIDGILLQLPLPEGLDDAQMTELIDPQKDVDGLTSISAGRVVQGRPALVPCTPAGVMLLIEHAGQDLRGAHAVVLGRSNLVGRPLSTLLLQRDATVTVCHSKTPDLGAITRQADVLVSCVGRPGLITGEMVKPGALVIDVGTTRTDDGLRGDIDFDSVSPVAGLLTPVPGGVGPMTIACLLDNTVAAASRRAGHED
jgi:methylenetetrahydrofolate dehydrogenase (NADP+)/methenyltetrahydrofolate cyclohydrolase